MRTTALKSPLVLLGLATLALYVASCSSSHEHHAQASHPAQETAKPAAAAMSDEKSDEEKDAGGDEETIDVAQLPAAVQATGRQVFGTLDGVKASRESDEGLMLYEMNGKGSNGMALSVKCVAAGQVLELERTIPTSGLPADASANLHSAFPDGSVVSAEEVEIHFFEVNVKHGGKTEEVRVGASGRVHRQDEDGEHEDEEHEEHGGDSRH